jgi:hypothetical protein
MVLLVGQGEVHGGSLYIERLGWPSGQEERRDDRALEGVEAAFQPIEAIVDSLEPAADAGIEIIQAGVSQTLSHRLHDARLDDKTLRVAHGSVKFQPSPNSAASSS